MSLQTFVDGIGARIKTWIGNDVKFVEGAAVAVWDVTLPIVETMAPIEWAQAVPIIVQAITDIGTGNLADIETSVLMKAEALGVTIFKDFSSRETQAIIGLVQAFHPQFATPTPAPAPAPAAAA